MTCVAIGSIRVKISSHALVTNLVLYQVFRITKDLLYFLQMPPNADLLLN